MNLFKFFLFALIFQAQAGFAAEELITTGPGTNGETVAYVLNTGKLPPKYVIILFPGGSGILDPHLEDGKLVYGFKGNFVMRARKEIVDDEFVTVATNSTSSKTRMQTLLDDLKIRFPAAQIFLMGTSRGTDHTMALAAYLSERIAGEIHSSSMRSVASFDARKFKNRHLLVHHRNDGCHASPFSFAEYSHEQFGNELIVMEGGTSTGDLCEPRAYHGYNGIEKLTVDAIKKWIKRGETPQTGNPTRSVESSSQPN